MLQTSTLKIDLRLLMTISDSKIWWLVFGLYTCWEPETLSHRKFSLSIISINIKNVFVHKQHTYSFLQTKNFPWWLSLSWKRQPLIFQMPFSNRFLVKPKQVSVFRHCFGRQGILKILTIKELESAFEKRAHLQPDVCSLCFKLQSIKSVIYICFLHYHICIWFTHPPPTKIFL